jgi:type IV secretion/conjugal transfer VirB4 family ATPase
VICAKDIRKEYREAGALNELIGIYAAVDEHTFLTKSGHVLQALRVQGADQECLDPAQLDYIARRFEAAMRIFPASFRIYQILLKRDHAPLPHEEHRNRMMREAIRNRIEYLEAKAADLYTLDLFFVIEYEANLGNRSASALQRPVETIAKWFSETKTLCVLEEHLTRAVAALATKVNSFLVQLRDLVGMELLRVEDAFQVFAWLLNYAPYKSDCLPLHSYEDIDWQLASSALECHRGHLLLDNYYVRVLTLKEPPAQTYPNLLDALQDLPSNFVAVSEWKREENAPVRRAIHSRRRHHHNTKSSLLNYLNWSEHPLKPEEMLIDDSSVAHVADLGQNLSDMEVEGCYFGQFSLTVILYGQDAARVERGVAECLKLFSTHDAQLTEERYNLLNAWLAALPGNGTYNLRRLWLTNTNYADLAFLFAHSSGEAWNPHLDREYLALVETDHGTPYFLNLHADDVAHSLVLGATGSGKSFLLNFLVTHLQKYDPFTCIFDLGGGYAATTELFGGASVKAGIERGCVRIKPFSLPPTADNHHFLFRFFQVLIESSGYRMDRTEERDLFEAVGNLYEAPEEIRTLRSLCGMVSKRLAAQLYPWTSDGPYGALFDNAEDNLTFARFQTFDFEGMDRFPQVLEPLLFYILHRANAAISDQPATSKWFVIDEAWRFFRNPTTRLYIVEALKTWRKRNAALILATQSGEDLTQSEVLPLVAESCPTKVFLANPGMDEEWYRSTFKLNQTEARRIATLVPKQQFLLKQPDRAKVLNLNVDRKGYWLYTNSPYDNQRKQQAFSRYGFARGLEILAQEVL